jgi:tetratricopeptide (TPR) repeat protein
MNKRMIVTTLCCFLSATAVAMAQGVSAYFLKYTPAQLAQFDKAYRMENAAEAALNAGQYELAISDARASTVSDSPRLAQDVLVAALAAEGKRDEATKIYASIYAHGGQRANDLLPYALMLVEDGQWSKAVDVYNRALQGVGSFLFDGRDLLLADSAFAYDDPEPADLEADIHIAMGFVGINDFGIAGPATLSSQLPLIEIKKALALEPDAAFAQLAYAWALENSGQRDAAKAAFHQITDKYSGGIKISAEKELGIYVAPTPTAPAAASSQSN